MNSTLPDTLKEVDWTANIDNAFPTEDSVVSIEKALLLVAIWSRQLELADEGNPAICFVREMQVAVQQSCALIGLCLYKPAAASVRTLLESCLYYTYFRSHPEELTSLLRVDKYYLSKKDIVEYHKLHSKKFSELQDIFGLIGRMERWYSRISAVVHGQIPGAWNNHDALNKISFSQETHALAVEAVVDGVQLSHEILLCTSGQRLWSSFSPDSKRHILKGIAGEKRKALGLDLG